MNLVWPSIITAVPESCGMVVRGRTLLFNLTALPNQIQNIDSTKENKAHFMKRT